jgi:PRC-barrel domain
VLHKIDKIRGFHILAADGEIGHVDEFLVDGRDWSVRYLVVDTSNWIGGRLVLISREVVDAIDSPNRKIHVRLTRDEIKRGPSVDTADIETIETLPAVWIM